MNKISRREFIGKSVQFSACVTAGIAGSKLYGSDRIQDSTNPITAVIPMPIQVVIDDVGWWSGEDGSKRQEPYRTGMNRNHVPADYQAIVELGCALGIRPQAAMVLCEWDKGNILRKLPTSTWMGKNWDNKKWVGSWLEEAADIIVNNKQHFEITLHGIGHEYWEGDTFTRAEWADRNKRMRPRDQVEKHLDFFELLMNQNNLGRFPTSFVPTAFLHAFGPTEGHDVSIAEILKKRGITYINTPLAYMYNAKAVQYNVFGFDAGVMTIDRGKDEHQWNVIGAQPSAKLNGPTCGMHWPNLLHSDPTRNMEIVKGWVAYLAPYNDKLDTLLAPDSGAFQNQLAHQVCTKIKLREKDFEIDFKDTDILPDDIGKNGFTLKVKSAFAMRFQSNSINILVLCQVKYVG